MNNSLLTVRELSSFLHMHPKTIYKWTYDSKIPYLKVNRLIRFKKEEIDVWQRNQQYKSTQLIQLIPKFELSLENYDKMLLKGRSALGKNSKRWNYGFGTIYVRKTKGGNDRWYVDFKNREGRRLRKIIPNAQSREEALLALQEEVRKEFDKEHAVKRGIKKTRFNDVAAEYLENYAKINNVAWKRVEGCLKVLCRFFGSYYLSEISPYMIEKYKAKRLKNGLKPSSINRELSVLKRAFNLAISWEMTEKNPVQKVRFLRQSEPRERILAEAEEGKLLESSSEHVMPVIIMALHTGMRKSEIANLRWDHVDLENREIEVIKTKSGRKRIIPISKDLYEVLTRIKNPSNGSEFVFQYADPKTRTKRHLTYFRRAFENACKRAGIKGLTFHDLRHTFASRLVRKGIDLITVKDLLGHSSVRTTERYSHSNREQKQRAVELLSKKRLEKMPQKAENLSHICHTEEGDTFPRVVIH